MNTAKSITLKAYWPDRAAPAGVEQYIHIDNIVREAVEAYLRRGDGHDAARVLSLRVGRRNVPRLLPLVHQALAKVLGGAPRKLVLIQGPQAPDDDEGGAS